MLNAQLSIAKEYVGPNRDLASLVAGTVQRGSRGIAKRMRWDFRSRGGGMALL